MLDVRLRNNAFRPRATQIMRFNDTVFALQRMLGTMGPVLLLMLVIHFTTKPAEIELEVEEVALKYTAYHCYDLRKEVRDGETYLIIKRAYHSSVPILFFWIGLVFTIGYAIIDPQGKLAAERARISPENDAEQGEDAKPDNAPS